uniref:C-type lectin domain-containing protein n=1 Tax=Ursus maritimus TaxID=29073 RepID=A0A452UMU1_URSMA
MLLSLYTPFRRIFLSQVERSLTPGPLHIHFLFAENVLSSFFIWQCFYFSENTRTWAASQNFCASHAATLASSTPQKTIGKAILLNYKISRNDILTILNIGLSREPGQTWKWIDGTIYSGWFKIIGIGECAYLHKIGISSASTHLVRKWICSKPDTLHEIHV